METYKNILLTSSNLWGTSDTQVSGKMRWAIAIGAKGNGQEKD